MQQFLEVLIQNTICKRVMHNVIKQIIIYKCICTLLVITELLVMAKKVLLLKGQKD